MITISIPVTDDSLIEFYYTNHKNIFGRRVVMPRALEFGATEWHPGPPQWFLRAWDMQKLGERIFAMKDITNPHPYAQRYTG